MARNTNLYHAYIVENEELKDIVVDIFNLPYDRFGPENPLVIHDDVSLGRAKGRNLPNMRHVVLTKSLNLVDFRIVPDTVLPDELSELICEHSISSMDDLPQELPLKLQKISIRHALLNNIKKDKDGARDSAYRFAQSHPNIIVTDGVTNLSDLLKDIENENQKQGQVQPADNVSKKTPAVKQKNQDYYSTEEIIGLCRHLFRDFDKISDEDLARYIKRARSVKAGLKLNPVSLKRADGAVLVCVHRDCFGVIVDFIRSQITADAERAKKVKTKKDEINTPTPVVDKVSTTAEPVYQLGNRTFKPTQIKKYIPKRQWGIIRSACGTDKKQLLDILREIDVINVNPLDTTGNKVYYIQDAQIKASRTLELKSARCLTQGFKSLISRQRIVWAVSGNAFVCVDFFPDHEHTLYKYKVFIRNVEAEAQKINLAECYDVADLIRELSTKRDAENVSAPQETPDITEVPVEVLDVSVESETVDTPALQSEMLQPDVLQSTEPQPESQQPTMSQPEPEKNIDSGAKKPDSASNIGDSSGVVWAEMYSMNVKLLQQIKLVDDYRAVVLNAMQVETNTDKLLRMTEEILRSLHRKKELEEMMSKLHEMNKILLRWQTGLDKQK